MKSNDNTSCVMIIIPHGTIDETNYTRGVAHFLEHYLFRGTFQYPTQVQLQEQMDALGDWNAFTGHTHTGFYLRVNPEDLTRAETLLKEIVFELHPTVANADFFAEKEIVKTELGMVEGNPYTRLEQETMEMIFGDTPMSRSLGGTLTDMDNLSIESVIDFHKEFYKPENAVMLICSPGEPDFHGGGDTPIYRSKIPKYNNLTRVKKLPSFHHDKSYVGFSLYINKTFATKASDMFFMEFFNLCIEKHLWNILRVQRGLCYNVNSGFITYQRDTVLTIHTTLPKDTHLKDNLKLLVDSFCEANISEETFIKKKISFIKKKRIELQSSLSMCMFTVDQAAYSESNQMRPFFYLEDAFAAIEELTYQEFSITVKRFCKRQHTYLVVA